MIHLYNDLYLSKFDKLNYAVYRRSLNSKSGKEKFTAISFQTHLTPLIKTVKEMYLKDSLILGIENDDIERLINELERLEKVVIKNFERIV